MSDAPEWWNMAATSDKSIREAKSALPFVDLEELRDVLNAFIEAKGDIEKTAKNLERPLLAVHAQYMEAIRIAGRRGMYEAGDMTKVVPQGMHIKGISTLYKIDPATGDKIPAIQWVKSNIDKEDRLKYMGDAIMALVEPLRGTQKKAPKPKGPHRKDILCVYPMGDPHIGMRAWAEDAGEDFDLTIATTNIRSAIDKCVAQAPPSKRALFIPLGDNYHMDNASNTTARSGNNLDVDGRWPKVIRAGIDAMRWCIHRMLEKHEIVDVVVVIGNHDDHSAVMLSLALEVAYENEPRVNILSTANRYHYYRFGRVMIGMTHGDTVKAKDLPGIMATDYAKDWGDTRYRHWYTGHVHHESLKEYRGCTVETMRVLPSADAWHHGAGYRSDRDMRVDVWDAEHGPVQKIIVGIEKITGKRNRNNRTPDRHVEYGILSAAKIKTEPKPKAKKKATKKKPVKKKARKKSKA